MPLRVWLMCSLGQYLRQLHQAKIQRFLVGNDIGQPRRDDFPFAETD
jgi:hypothetical protein